MRVRFVESSDLEELESTANMLLLEGWERDSSVQFLSNGKYFISFIKYSSPAGRDIGYAREEPTEVVRDCPPPTPTPVYCNPVPIAGNYYQDPAAGGGTTATRSILDL